MTDDDVPVEITADLIASMRASGRGNEAKELLYAYQDNLKKSWESTRKTMRNDAHKKRVFKWKKNGLCNMCGKERENKKFLACESCRKKDRERQVKK